jgi:hypothetical protein
MKDRETLRFEHRGCTLIVVATNVDGEWHSHFDLKCPSGGTRYTLQGREGPYPSLEEAFEKAKQWACREIGERMATPGSSAAPA